MVYDGKNQNAPLIRKITGQIFRGQDVLIKSSEKDMVIRFQSDSVLSGRGFKAVFSYMPHGLGDINFCSTSNLCEVGQGNCNPGDDFECAGGLKCGHSTCPANLELGWGVDCCYEPWWKSCSDSLDMDAKTLVSPQSPSIYDNNQHCAWLLQVDDNKVVSLIIDWFSVRYKFRIREKPYCTLYIFSMASNQVKRVWRILLTAGYAAIRRMTV